MLTIYHAPGARSQRLIWLCEEMGVPYETREASFQNPSEDFTAVSPLRTIPAMRDGDIGMFDSIAIMTYIMNAYGPTDLEVKPNEPGYAEYLQFLHFAESGVTIYGNPLIATRFQAPDDQKKNWTASFLENSIERRLKFAASQLEGRDYIAAGRFTAADIALAYLGGFLKFAGVADRAPASFMAYCERLAARPAYLRMLAVR
jgi:glutathione S-transferase